MPTGFDNRIVSYEKIHSISAKDIEKLVDAVNPRPGEKILDAACGYGSVGKAILDREPRAHVIFVDESPVQIERARQNLPAVSQDQFIQSSLPSQPFGAETFDKIVIKMGLHEVPFSRQEEILATFNHILKLSGRVVVWDIMLDHTTQELFQDIIRKKDKLADFNLLTKNRYFFREEEFLANSKRAGFAKVTDFHKINYRFSSQKRLSSELQNNTNKLDELNQYIRKKFTPQLKNLLSYEDLGDDIQFTITKKIFILEK